MNSQNNTFTPEILAQFTSIMDQYPDILNVYWANRKIRLEAEKKAAKEEKKAAKAAAKSQKKQRTPAASPVSTPASSPIKHIEQEISIELAISEPEQQDECFICFQAKDLVIMCENKHKACIDCIYILNNKPAVQNTISTQFPAPLFNSNVYKRLDDLKANPNHCPMCRCKMLPELVKPETYVRKDCRFEEMFSDTESQDDAISLENDEEYEDEDEIEMSEEEQIKEYIKFQLARGVTKSERGEDYASILQSMPVQQSAPEPIKQQNIAPVYEIVNIECEEQEQNAEPLPTQQPIQQQNVEPDEIQPEYLPGTDFSDDLPLEQWFRVFKLKCGWFPELTSEKGSDISVHTEELKTKIQFRRSLQYAKCQLYEYSCKQWLQLPKYENVLRMPGNYNQKKQNQKQKPQLSINPQKEEPSAADIELEYFYRQSEAYKFERLCELQKMARYNPYILPLLRSEGLIKF